MSLTSDLPKEFPDAVWNAIAAYLPQQDVVNLALVNYRLYVIAIRNLYRNLWFKKSVVLPNCHLESAAYWTLIGSSSNVLAKKELHNQIFKARQAVLLQSLTINPELLIYIEKVAIFEDSNSDDTAQINEKLIELIKGNCLNLQSFQVFNKNRDLHLSDRELPHLKKLKTCAINHLLQLQELPTSLKHLHVNLLDTYKIEKNACLETKTALLRLYGLESLYLSSDEISTLTFLHFVINDLKPPKSKKFQFKTLKIIYYHGFNDYNATLRDLILSFIYDYCDLSALVNLELVLGCDIPNCSCLPSFSDELCEKGKLTNLRKLAFIEKTEQKRHDFVENWDISVGRLILKLPATPDVEYLSIRHSPPPDGNLENGLEGNFIRRKNLYQDVLPKLRTLRVLISPSFFASCACYETITSDLLWNGCNCEFCSKYLSLFDEYIMKHFYLDTSSGLLKDVISPRFFAAAANSLARRMFTPSDVMHNASDLDLLSFPPTLSTWDFHGYSYFMHQDGYNCEFNQSLFPQLAKVISHFMDDYVQGCMKRLPLLSFCILSGVYFDTSDRHSTGGPKSLFDDPGTKPDLVVKDH
ncbi:GTPase inhibitor [Komagataella phaffii CBS 7435]|nr:GQ67_00812T0 [Komagataella phaffii]AOA67546.1 GQ68_00577T0 [Komagataella phaffii GS115]CAH2448073.1 GTPase inhibitor [Komagataella phaffii CBS 7435]CCA38218.1 GTPase inhibitor [Komagataella phaffii CBS 7435]